MFKKNDPKAVEAGRKGGIANVRRHGAGHMAEIGNLGGQKMKERGKEWYSAIGKMSKRSKTKPQGESTQ